MRKTIKIKDLNVSESKWINLLAAHSKFIYVLRAIHSRCMYSAPAALLNDKLNIVSILDF